MLRKFGTVSLFVLFIGGTVFAQQAAAPTYTPTELQATKLENAKLKYQLAYEEEEAKKQDFINLTEQIKKDNSWPKEVQFNPTTMTFFAPAPPSAPKPEVKPEKK